MSWMSRSKPYFHPQNVVAAVDLGSQTFRLAVAEVKGKSPRVRASVLRNVRLGEGLASGETLSPVAIERGIQALREFRDCLDRFRPYRLRVCGTAALRQAKNAPVFLAEAERQGFLIEILSGEEEAAVAFRGVQATVPFMPLPFLMVDVGGGSSEFVLVGDDGVLFSRSLDVGAVVLAEAHILHDPPFPGEVEALSEAAGRTLVSVAQELPLAPKAIVGLGGTATTLAAMAQGMRHYDPARIRGFVLTQGHLRAQWRSLTALDTARRRALSGLDPARADIILAGLAIYREVLALTPCSELVVSEGGLLLGLLITMLLEESSEDVTRSYLQGLYV